MEIINKQWNNNTVSFIQKNYKNKVLDDKTCEDIYSFDEFKGNYFWDNLDRLFHLREEMLAYLNRTGKLWEFNAFNVIETLTLIDPYANVSNYKLTIWLKANNNFYIFTYKENGMLNVANSTDPRLQQLFDLQTRELINKKLVGICKPEKINIQSVLSRNRSNIHSKILSFWMIDLAGNDPAKASN